MNQYQSIDVFANRNIRKVSHGSDPNLVILQNLTGKDVRDRRVNKPLLSMSLEVVMITRAEVAEFKAFLATRCGRLVPFWLPSWDCDIKLNRTVTGGTAVLRFTRTEFVDAYFQTMVHAARKFLYFRTSGGTEIYRHILNASPTVIDADTEEVTVNAVTGDDPLTPTTYETICFLNFARLDSDRIEFNWIADDCCVATLQVKILQYDLIST